MKKYVKEYILKMSVASFVVFFEQATILFYFEKKYGAKVIYLSSLLIWLTGIFVPIVISAYALRNKESVLKDANSKAWSWMLTLLFLFPVLYYILC